MATAKKAPAKKSEAEQLVETWLAHSDLFAVEVAITGLYRDEDGEERKVNLGSIPGNLRRFGPGSFGFNLSGKVADTSPAGITSKGFQMSGNLVAIGSKNW